MKKGVTVSGGTILLGIFFLALVVVGVVWFSSYQTAIGQKEATEKLAEAIKPTFCTHNSKLNLKVRAIDQLTSSLTYRNATIYVVDKTSPSIEEYTIDTAPESTYDYVGDIICGHEYEIYVKTDNSTTVGTGPFTVDPVKVTLDEQNSVIIKKDVKVVRLDRPRVRIRDTDEEAFIYENSTGSTDYVTLGSGPSTIIFTSTSSPVQTGKTIGAGDEYNIEIRFKTEEADKQCGLNTLFAIDYADEDNPNDWQEPTVSLDGKELTDVKGKLQEDNALALTGYEKVYDLGMPIGEKEHKLTVNLVASSDVNPDYDITMRFICTGIYLSNKNANELLGLDKLAGFTDTPTRQEFALVDGASNYAFKLLVE